MAAIITPQNSKTNATSLKGHQQMHLGDKHSVNNTHPYCICDYQAINLKTWNSTIENLQEIFGTVGLTMYFIRLNENQEVVKNSLHVGVLKIKVCPVQFLHVSFLLSIRRVERVSKNLPIV